MVTISKAAEILGVSRQAIYKKISINEELSTHIKLVDNVKHIDDEGYRQLERLFHVNELSTDCQQPVNNLSTGCNSNDYIVELLNEQITSLKKELKILLDQLEIKDKQIHSLTHLSQQAQTIAYQQNVKHYLENSEKRSFLDRLFSRK